MPRPRRSNLSRQSRNAKRIRIAREQGPVRMAGLRASQSQEQSEAASETAELAMQNRRANNRDNYSAMITKNTTQILTRLRALMKNTQYVSHPLQAYIILSEDAHQNEYLSDRDKRREFVSGFTGSAGTAIVTEHHACLWTDGRYFLQATNELDENWTLMKEGLPGTPSKGEWLGKTLPVGSRIGVDPLIMSYYTWKQIQDEVESYEHILIPITTNLVDLIWTDQPVYPDNLISHLPLKYTGKGSGEKLTAIREKMAEKNASLLLVTALDEIAWTLNLRGSDIPYNPVFFSYLLITLSDVHLFVNQTKLTPRVLHHLQEELQEFSLHSYDHIREFLDTSLSTEMCKSGKIWISQSSAYVFVNLVKEKQRINSITPIAIMKTIKNDVEINGLINAHIKDAAALCRYFAWLEKEVRKGGVTEISGAEQLEKFRSEQEDFVGLSFKTISGVGPNAAVIHYSTSTETNRPITMDEMYLCDSGAQFLDGTTDVTRTVHFGTPSDYEKECFTRVFKGVVNLATAVFPRKVKGNVLDTLARKYLWDVGLNYMHGTGHGIGAYLNVHEAPIGISWRHYPNDPGMDEGMFLSDEPGYYEEGHFGIRIENIIRTVAAQPKYLKGDQTFLTFETVTLVPIQTKLLLPELLSNDEISFLNEYHETCREKVGPLLKEQGHTEALAWLINETRPIG